MTMAHGYVFLFLTYFTLVASDISTDSDLPCSAVTTKYGFVCKCNDTYCDTITAPTQLKTGKFYHYVTSNQSPGFTKTQGNFENTAQLEPDYSVSNDSTEVYVWLNASATYQTFKGMGAALTDTNGALIQALSTGTMNNMMESLFGAKGIEYSYIRMGVASTDFSPSYYTNDDVDGDVDLKYWNLTTEDYTIKIPLIKLANATSSRGLRILTSPWSAPSWMKTSNSSYQGFVYNKYLEPWAKYLVKYLQAYKEQGIPIWGMTLGNEVILSLYFGPSFSMGNTIMIPAQQRYWVKKFLGPMLQEAGLEDVQLYALDDERPFLTWSSDRLFTDAEYSKYVAGVSIHWYFDWNTTTSQLDLFHEKFPDKSIIYAEACINDAQAEYEDDVVALGHWSDATRYILDVYEAFCNWSEMYLDWNIALDTEGGPVGLDGFYLDAPLIINTTTGEFYKQPIFYSMGHFSKFIPPGAMRINVQVKQVSNDTYDEECSVASQDLYRRKMAQTKLKSETSNKDKSSTGGLVGLPTSVPIFPSTAVRVLATLNPDGSQTVVVYNPRNEAANLTLTDAQKGTFKRTLEPYSINTFVYW